MGKKILVLTEMDFRGSGYFYLMSPILQGLSKLGYDIKVVGLGYTGLEHNFDYTIVPTRTVQDGVATAANIIRLWTPDIFICGLDIPMQIAVFDALESLKVKYIAITPLENPPLTQSWAVGLMKFGFTFFISALGAKAAKAAGVFNTGYLPVGIDTESTFYPADEEEREGIRRSMGYAKDEYIILTVADNQERKNIWASMKAVSMLLHPSITSEEFDDIMSGGFDKRIASYPKSGKYKYVLVTREHSPVGHKLRDLAVTMDINKEFIIFERGIPQADLRKLYISSDLFLLTSKAEGLGVPVLEAMACNLPVMATDTGALTELLQDGRGYLIREEYGFTDVWGNSWRSMVDVSAIVSGISAIVEYGKSVIGKNTRDFVQARTLETSVNMLKDKIEELTNG